MRPHSPFLPTQPSTWERVRCAVLRCLCSATIPRPFPSISHTSRRHRQMRSDHTPHRPPVKPVSVYSRIRRGFLSRLAFPQTLDVRISRRRRRVHSNSNPNGHSVDFCVETLGHAIAKRSLLSKFSKLSETVRRIASVTSWNVQNPVLCMSETETEIWEV